MIEILKNIIVKEQDIFNICINSFGNKKGVLVSYFDQRCFNNYSNNLKYEKLLNEKFTVYIDGIGMRLAAKLFNIAISDVFNGSDMNTKLFDFFIRKRKKVFIIGSKIDKYAVLNIAKTKGLNVVGYQDGYFSKSRIKKLASTISQSQAEAVIVGMGVPKQEFFTAEISKCTDAKLYLCVGNFLEYYFGKVKRAPVFLRNSGFEWLFRMMIEPKRLWKRYIIGIPFFFYRVLKCKLLQKT